MRFRYRRRSCTVATVRVGMDASLKYDAIFLPLLLRRIDVYTSCFFILDARYLRCTDSICRFHHFCYRHFSQRSRSLATQKRHHAAIRARLLFHYFSSWFPFWRILAIAAAGLLVIAFHELLMIAKAFICVLQKGIFI